jgi:UDP-N-acetylmuramate--alanine ligase
MFERYRVIHFTGIGGIGMSGIAEVLYNLGYEVRGSDVRASETTERLAGLGISIHMGHSAGNVRGAHVVVVSSAIGEDNPEVEEANRLGIPVIPRAEMLAELGRLKYAVLVAGSHGKTTTTSLISTMLAHGGLDPTVIIGGKLKALGTNARLGRGDFMVAEADESDGSFLRLSPTIGVVTSIDREHMDYFRTMDALKGAFLSFMNMVPFYGLSVLCVEDQYIRELLPSVHRRVLTYGFSEDAELRAVNLRKGFMRMEFDALLGGRELGSFTVPSPGEHSVLNCLACMAVGLELQMDEKKMQEAIRDFKGIQRRLEFKGEAREIKVYDDYGHHPTEITATLGAVKESLGEGRLFVVFQPHRYTRTRDLMEEFAGAFDYADAVVLMDIYPAAEKPIDGITSEALLERMKRNDVFFVRERKEVAEFVRSKLREGDTVITLGAGDVWRVGEEVLDVLKSDGR